MKRALSLILALILCLSLCACGGGVRDIEGKMTKEEMLAAAQSFDTNKFNDDCNNNIVQAKEKYIGNIYRRTVLVTEIQEDGCYAGNMFVPLDKEDIVKLTVGKSIDIVFKIGDIEHKVEEEDSGGYGIITTTSNIITPEQVYYIGDISKLKAEVIWMHRDDAFVYIQGIGYCTFDVDLTLEEAEKYSEGDTVYVEGTVHKKAESEMFSHNGYVRYVYYEIPNAVLTTP